MDRQSIGHYELVRKLARGGMGDVYLARDTKLDRRVALKVLPADVAATTERLERFVREARTLATLDHPNIVTIHSVEEAASVHFLTMAYVEGRTLDELIRPGGLPAERLLELAIPMTDGLRAAHERGVVHRDLKPRNVMVDDDGRLRILDFGLAKLETGAARSAASRLTTEAVGPELTREGTILGTYPYMSPEQVEGKRVDARSDIFSLGVMLYELASGRRPFRGETTVELISSILKDTPRPLAQERPDLPPRLAGLVDRCLDKDPAARVQTARELLAELAEIAAPTVSATGTVAGQAPIRARSRWIAAAVVVAAATAVATLTLLVTGLFSGGEPEPEPSPQQSWEQITFFADSAVSPALSPDGRMLTFLRGASTFFGPAEVHVKLLPDGDPVPLTRDGLAKMSPVFSPDGTSIAYTVVEQGGKWDTWIVPVFGGQPRRWFTNASGLTWVDRRRVLFSEISEPLNMGLATALESRAESRWIHRPEHPRGMIHRSSLSPDGRWVLAAQMETGAWLRCLLLPYDGTGAGRPVGPEGACTHVAWSPDGGWMYFSASAGDAYHLWRQRFPDGEPEQLTAGPTEQDGLTVAPDGRSLLTSVGIRQSTVVIAAGRGEYPLAMEGYAWLDEIAHHGFPRPFSNDGSRLFFLRRRSISGDADQLVLRHPDVAERSGELWGVDVASGRAEAILPGSDVRSYDISPDDQVIVAEGSADDGTPTIWLVRVDRREPPETIPLEDADSLRFGPEGGVYFRKVEPQGNFVWYRSPDGRETRRALDVPVIDFHGVSQDAAWLLASSITEKGTFRLHAFPTTGGPPRIVCEACSLNWSPGGRFAYFLFPSLRGGHTVLVTLPSPGSLPELPRDGVGPRDVASLANIVWSKDGLVHAGPDPETYAYSRTSVQRNIFRVPLR